MSARGGHAQSVNVPDPGYSGGDDPFASFRQNPGTRVTMRRHDTLTKKKLLDHPFQFPAPPLEQLTRNLTANWTDYDTIADGQHSRPGSMQLQAIGFDTIVVCDDDGFVYPWAHYNPWNTRKWDTAQVVRELGTVLRSMTPFWLTIEEVNFKPNRTGRSASGSYDFGTKPVLRMLASLRTLSSTDRAGEPDAKYVTVAFTEFRAPSMTERAKGKGGADSKRVPATIAMQRFVTGKPKVPGKTLHDLAVYYYGSAAKWTFVKAQNPWLGNVTATHDLSDLTTAALKAAYKQNRKLKLPRL
jgi:hypothetical protein